MSTRSITLNEAQLRALIRKQLNESDELGAWGKKKRDIKAAVEEYIGAPVDSVDVKSDPKVVGTVAILVNKTPEDSFHMLLTDYVNTMSVAEIAANLEETEFTSWPPFSNNTDKSVGLQLRGRMGWALK